jgi:hypothetical protein
VCIEKMHTILIRSLFVPFNLDYASYTCPIADINSKLIAGTHPIHWIFGYHTTILDYQGSSRKKDY